MSKKSLTRHEKKTIRKFKSYVARGNHYGKYPNFYAIDEIMPPSMLCEIVGKLHYNNTKKLEIPFRVKGV